MSTKELEEFIKSETFKNEVSSLMLPYSSKLIEECIQKQSQNTKNIVADTVKMVFLEMGLDISKETRELKKDFNHMRQTREGCEAVKRNALKTILTVTIPTITYFIGSAMLDKLTTMIK